MAQNNQERYMATGGFIIALSELRKKKRNWRSLMTAIVSADIVRITSDKKLWALNPKNLDKLSTALQQNLK